MPFSCGAFKVVQVTCFRRTSNQCLTSFDVADAKSDLSKQKPPRLIDDRCGKLDMRRDSLLQHPQQAFLNHIRSTSLTSKHRPALRVPHEQRPANEPDNPCRYHE